jgi:uncharacterized membrane protein YqjE
LTQIHIASEEAAHDVARCGRRGRTVTLAVLVILPLAAIVAWAIWPERIAAWATSGRPVAAAALGMAFVAGVWLVALLHDQDQAEAALQSFPTS